MVSPGCTVTPSPILSVHATCAEHTFPPGKEGRTLQRFSVQILYIRWGPWTILPTPRLSRAAKFPSQIIPSGPASLQLSALYP